MASGQADGSTMDGTRKAPAGEAAAPGEPTGGAGAPEGSPAPRGSHGRRNGQPHERRRSAAQTLRGFINLRDGRASYETIRKRILAGTRIDGQHVCILIVAMLIASIGLNVDSTEAIVGAMLICPLMGSVLAIAYAIATADVRLLRSALVGLVGQVLVCLATSTLYFVLSPISTETNELLTNSQPTIWDVLIALAGGFAGGIGNTRKQEPATLVAGVAVATALMPPLCASGYGIAMRSLGTFASAFYEFLLNVVFIAIASQAAFMLVRVPLAYDADGDGVISPEERVRTDEWVRRTRRRLALGTLVFLIPCTIMTMRVVETTMAQSDGSAFAAKDTYDVEMTTKELRAVCPELVDYRVGSQDSFDEGSGSLRHQVVATVTTSEELPEERQGELERLIRVHVGDLNSVAFSVAGP